MSRAKTLKGKAVKDKEVKNENRFRIALSKALVSFSKESNAILNEIGLNRDEEENKENGNTGIEE